MGIIEFVTAFGAGAIIIKLIELVWQWATGKHGRDQASWRQRDREAKARRILEEYAHTLRIQWHMLHGTPYEDMPPWPKYKTTED